MHPPGPPRDLPPPPPPEDWARSDAYFAEYLFPSDPALDYALENSRANGLPPFMISPALGQFLRLVAQSVNAKKILEIGTLGGYSSICLARGFVADDGKVITLEVNNEFAQVARENIAHASLSSKVDVIVGPAEETLKTFRSDEPFDLVFIDADKEGYPVYVSEAKRLTRKGGIIIVDNVNLGGRVALDPEDTKHEHVKAVRQVLQQLKDDAGLKATVLNIAGAKAYDGLLYAVKR